MLYGEIFVPQVLEGFLVRVGRYVALPDIEAQLAPNDYMYSRSMTYAYDNYTNTGIQTTLAVNKNWFVQLGVSLGTDTMIWNAFAKLPNPYPNRPGAPNPLFPNATMYKDPGAIPSYAACIRYQSDSADDSAYFCGDALNNGQWGYNNLQWIGGVYYHKFSDQWHIAVESYNIHQNDAPNARNPLVQTIAANGGTPFTNPASGILATAPFMAQCNGATQLTCTASAQTFLFYLNYQTDTLDNISLRGEFFDDMQGQRTGVKTRYLETALGWQHWWSPQVEFRPEISFYRSLDAKAFNSNDETGAAPTRNWAAIAGADLIWHF
jgi:hypothetical protein